MRQPSAWAPPLIHLSFLVALLAHGVGGLWNREGSPLVLGSAWQELGDGRQMRLEGLETEALPDGHVKRVQARVVVRSAAGEERATVGYNEPLSRGLGSELFLLAEAGRAITGATISSGASRCTLRSGASCELGALVVTLVTLQESPRTGAPVAVFRVLSQGVAPSQLMLLPGQQRELGGSTLRFDEPGVEPAISLRARSTPGNPIALGSVVLLALGLLLMGRRWLM